MDPAPIIGITSYLEQARTGVWDVRASFLPEVYLRGVTDAGGIAVVLPPQPVAPGVAEAIVGALDGLVLSGGADVDPARYGQRPHERTGAPRTDRDEFEAAVLQAAIDIELPFLGICRGAQVLNVERGGTLTQHLPDLVGDDRYQLGAGRFNRIEVEVDPGSRIGGLFGDEPRAVADLYHHQGIDRVGDGLTVTSRTADGVIESLELDAVPFGIAVQWHPEENAADRRLFAGLVRAARAHRRSRTGAPAPRASGAS
ncbi:gamma-glutamyl-gamma-aminobutyrate hydrolase family protein [Leucobacter allii]|uniref:Gamma-glutamyl-gamma-aminobutyrate hydrolase family protein n=1 Tax=Leucobacter allii TaxID=2932247 RepID=A0ABY4FHJ6_9MICO|nr:gamma-glutamyl-gamma-aminobutyrate hydrolase family protein [Leucobacter allii]UOQ56151.1 gamma-glutamyl-gamma-aminobutyrate hydrolase family protein [Leucobacter allii]UOR00619.1 gamma-glutamyl-gamma-aminobutyrate hydrolase family protein [Leucobacter allii]